MKKYILFAIIVFSALWVFSSNFVQAAPLAVHPSNPRYFTDGSGKAVYLTGTHTWYNLQDGGTVDPPPAFDYNAYLNLMQSHNHNFMRMWNMEFFWYPGGGEGGGWPDRISPMPYQRIAGYGNALDGKPKFDLTKLNQAYFDRMRSRVIAARDRGIYVSIMLFDDWGVDNVDSWKGNPYNINNNMNGINGDLNGDGIGWESHTLQIPAITALQKAYVRKVIDTVNDLDNVLYEICNEGDISSLEWHYHMINFIKDYEINYKSKRHPVGMTVIFDKQSGWTTDNNNLFNSPADWISPNSPNWNGVYENNPPASDGSKVIIPDTDHMANNILNSPNQATHVWVWKSFARGLNPIYMDELTELTGIYEFDTPYAEDVRWAMGHTLTYANKMNLVSMTPQNSLSSTSYCLANSGQEYLAYQPGSGSFTVNLQAGIYSYEWFNPSSGSVAGTGSITVSAGSRSFTPPFSGDAVLYLKITSSAPDPVPLPAGNWVKVADEGGTCVFDGTLEVWYGASDKYFYKTVPGGTACSNSVFGDPLVGVTKACYVRQEQLPQQNPIAHYKLDETSGTTASDSSGNNNTGILMNGPVWTTGKIGNALSFDGTNDWINIPYSSAFNITSQLTLSAWIKTTASAPGNGKGIIWRGDNDQNAPNYGNLYRLNQEGNTAGFLVVNSDRTVYAVGFNTIINDGKWHNLVGVFDSSQNALKLFIDGIQDGPTEATTGTLRTSTQPISVGSQMPQYSSIEFFSGLIDDVRVYNRALSASEIQTLYNAATTDTTPPSAPTGVAVI